MEIGQLKVAAECAMRSEQISAKLASLLNERFRKMKVTRDLQVNSFQRSWTIPAISERVGNLHREVETFKSEIG